MKYGYLISQDVYRIGLLPYRDISMIITPLFPYICSWILKVFGDEMIIFRIVEIIGLASVLFVMYKIMCRLKINKGVAIISIFAINYVYKEMLGFDYNWAVLLIQLLLLYIDLRPKQEVNQKKELILGILARNNSTFQANNRNSIFHSICIL